MSEIATTTVCLDCGAAVPNPVATKQFDIDESPTDCGLPGSGNLELGSLYTGTGHICATCYRRLRWHCAPVEERPPVELVFHESFPTPGGGRGLHYRIVGRERAAIRFCYSPVGKEGPIFPCTISAVVVDGRFVGNEVHGAQAHGCGLSVVWRAHEDGIEDPTRNLILPMIWSCACVRTPKCET